MKKISLITISLFLIWAYFINAVAHADSFVNLQKCGVNNLGSDLFSDRQNCEATTGSECIEFPGGSCSYLVVEDIIGDDSTQPIYSSPTESESCDGQEACEAILLNKVCSQEVGAVPYIDAGYTSVYCSKFLGYIQVVVGKKLSEDPTKKAVFEATQAQERQFSAAMLRAKRAQQCGKDAMAYLLVRNSLKNLTTEQVKTLIGTYQTIKSLLESGSLATAVSEITATVSDGVIITEADKVAMNLFIQGCAQ